MNTGKIRNLKKGRFYREGRIFFPLFDREIDVFIDFDADLGYAERCVEALESLDGSVIDALCSGAVRYCEDYRDLLEETETDIPAELSGRAVLDYMTPLVMIIEKPKGPETAFHMDFDCRWEPEHGLEWVVRGNEVLFVGAFNDENPWTDRDYFRNASWNYVGID